MIRIKSNGKLLGVTCTGSESCEIANSYTAELESLNTWNTPWVALDLASAKRTLNAPPNWYNSGLSEPSHEFKPEDLEVVKLEECDE